MPDREGEAEIEHTGTGRFAWLTMRPMSLYESGESNGAVSLGEFFVSQPKVMAKNELILKGITFLICRGGCQCRLACLTI